MGESGRQYTAAQVVLMAGDDLTGAGNVEFSEWQLTVAAWNRDRGRFGLRGFADHHPDHKRVMMEIMGKKRQNPIHMKFMEKIRPNYYRLTSLGRAEAARLRNPSLALAASAPASASNVRPAPTNKSGKASKRAAAETDRQFKPRHDIRRFKTDKDFHDWLTDFVLHPAFESWKEDPDEPRRWNDAQDFIELVKDGPETLAGRLEFVEDIARTCLDRCTKSGQKHIAGDDTRKISIKDLSGLCDFVRALQYRFERQLS